MTKNSIEYMRNLETEKHDRAMEAETSRANRAIEALRGGELEEAIRTDKAREKISRYEAKTNRKKYKTEAKTAKTVRKLNKAQTKEKRASAKAIPLSAKANLMTASAKQASAAAKLAQNQISKWIAEKNLEVKAKELKLDKRSIKNQEAQTAANTINNFMDKAVRLYSERMKDKISKREYQKALDKIKNDKEIARITESAKLYGQTDSSWKKLDSATKNLISLINAIIPF